MYEVPPSILESRLLGSSNIVDAAVVGIPDKENGQVPRAFVVLRPGFEETEENITNLIESRLQDHERIRGGLYFIQSIPRDENWKVRRDVLVNYEPKKPTDENAAKSFNEDGQVQELDRHPDGTFVVLPDTNLQSSSPRAKRASKTDPVAEYKSTRRGSMDCILEDSVTTVTPGVATSFCDTRGGGRRGSRIPSGNASRRGSVDSGDTPINSDTFTYWLQVCVDPSVSVLYSFDKVLIKLLISV